MGMNVSRIDLKRGKQMMESQKLYDANNGMTDLIYTRAERYEFRTISVGGNRSQAAKIKQIYWPNEHVLMNTWRLA